MRIIEKMISVIGQMRVTSGGWRKIASTLIIPGFFLTMFFIYFSVISRIIYDNFDAGGINVLITLPQIFRWPFLAFGIAALLFGTLKAWPRIFMVAFSAFCLLYFIIYTVQYYALYLTNRYLIPEAFLHLDQISLIADGRIVMHVVLIAVLIALIVWTLVRAVWQYDRLTETAGMGKALLFQTVATGFFFVIVYLPGFGSPLPNRTEILYGVPSDPPEVAFVKVVGQFYFGSHTAGRVTLPDDLARFMESNFGLTYNQQKEYPQVKDWIYRRPLSYKKVGNTWDRPNVIIFFIESLSANLVGAYNGRMNTPNIDEFAAESMVVEGYYNHTFPTINGLRGQLCSFYPVLGEYDYAKQGQADIKLYCLPHVLNKKNYSTAFFMYSPAVYSPMSDYTINIKKLMQACGFERVFMAEEIQKRLTGLDDLKGFDFKKSVNDLGMMTNLVKFLGEYSHKDRPFLITVSTIGTHPNLGDEEGKLAESIAKLDTAFGVFWEYFKKSQFYENTIVVLTADHTMPPTVRYKKFINSQSRSNFFFDEIACIIFDKGHDLPKRLSKRASSIDLVPSLLQLIDINNIPNPFQGLSLFSDRDDYPFLLSTLMSSYYVADDRGIREYLYRDDPNIDDRYRLMDGDIVTDLGKQEAGIRRWFAYNRYLNYHNKIWNEALESISRGSETPGVPTSRR